MDVHGVKPGLILAVLFALAALASVILWALMPPLLSLLPGMAPDDVCPNPDPCLKTLEDCRERGVQFCSCLLNGCSFIRNLLLTFGEFCAFLALVAAAYHFFVEKKAKSG